MSKGDKTYGGFADAAPSKNVVDERRDPTKGKQESNKEAKAGRLNQGRKTVATKNYSGGGSVRGYGSATKGRGKAC